jgi:manganese transport protein
LLRFTSEKAKMGAFVNPMWARVVGFAMAFLIIGLNVKLLFDIVTG